MVRALALATLVATLACAGQRSVPNLLIDPGFEQGGEVWSEHSDGYEIVDAPVRSGSRAAHLALHWPQGRGGRVVRVYALSQQLHPDAIPDRIEGWYRVDRFEKGSPRTALYVQVVAVVWGGDDSQPNRQIRYALAGLDQPPYEIENAPYVFVSKEPPELGEWTRFELPLRADMEHHWGDELPERPERLDVLFEARWDHKPDRSPIDADVYYDDLFVGGR